MKNFFIGVLKVLKIILLSPIFIILGIIIGIIASIDFVVSTIEVTWAEDLWTKDKK